MKKRKIIAIKPFKVIEVGINRKLVCDFLLVINSNLHHTSYRFGVIAAYCSNFGHCIFEPPFGGLRDNNVVHLGLIGKHVVDFLFVLIELISLGVTAKAIRTKIDRKSAISLQCGQFDPKFQVEKNVPLITLSLTIFTHTKKLCSRLSLWKCDFIPKSAVLRF